MITFTARARIDRVEQPITVRLTAISHAFGALARCDTLQEAEAVKAACDELPTRAARALNLAQSGKAVAPGVEPTPEELTALQAIMGVSVAAKEVRAAYDAMTCAITVSADDEGERFLRALATLKIALAAGAPP